MMEALKAQFEQIKAEQLQLDMTRGKPSPAQLDLSKRMIALLKEEEYKAGDGTDCRNYGGLDGLPELKQLFAELLEVSAGQIIIGGNSSLQLMHDTIINAMLHGVPGSEKPWGQQKVKFLCPVPGYDRHFGVCEHLGIEMVPVPMNAHGPDMDKVEELAAADPAIKGIWCVPKYSNPGGITYSDKVVRRLASMQAAADFRIMWDNAYAEHHLYETGDPLANVIELCAAAGNPERVFMYVSTSKITFAGGGVGLMVSGPENIGWMKKHLFYQTIGPDKLNQLRHLRFFGNANGLRSHMQQHATILRPRFEKVNEILERELGGTGLATWSQPRGGYFISLDVPGGCARRTVELAGELGVKLTKAGATFPYGQDPADTNIRIAPSLPSEAEIARATEVLCLCVKLAAAEKGVAVESL